MSEVYKIMGNQENTDKNSLFHATAANRRGHSKHTYKERCDKTNTPFVHSQTCKQRKHTT